MFSAEDASRRSTLRACGCIQMFLGLSAFCGAIAALSLNAKADLSYSGFWSGVFYMFLGMLSVVSSRFFDSQPPRGILLACMILNVIVSATSVFNAIWFIMSLTNIDVNSFGVTYGPATGKCLTIAVNYAHAILADGITRAILIIPVCITAAVIANKLRTACVVTTTTHHVAYSVPAQPYVTSVNPGYSQYSPPAPGYPSASTPYPDHPAMSK